MHQGIDDTAGWVESTTAECKRRPRMLRGEKHCELSKWGGAGVV